MFIWGFFLSAIFSKSNCVKKEDFFKLDSLLLQERLSDFKLTIDSKLEIEIDTNFLNYQKKFFNNAREKIELLKRTITQFEELSPLIQNNIVINFKNNRDLYKDSTLSIKVQELFKRCIKNDSLIFCFIAQYYAQRKIELSEIDSSFNTANASDYFKKCKYKLSKFDNYIQSGNTDIVIEKIDSLLSGNIKIMLYHKNKIKCLRKQLKKYMYILSTIDDFESYEVKQKQDLFQRLSKNKDLFEVNIAGVQANQLFLQYQNSDPLDKLTFIKYLLAKQFRTEYISNQKNLLRSEHLNAIKLFESKKYDEALNLISESKENLPTAITFKYFTDSLLYQYEILEEVIKEKRYKESFWISNENIYKNFQILIGSGLQYNPALMTMYWHFLSSIDSSSLIVPIYKLRESFGLKFSGEFLFHVSPEFMIGIHISYGNLYITKAILSNSFEISEFSKHDTERINNYVVNNLTTDIMSKYYLRTSPGLMPYLQISLGVENIRRKSVGIMELFESKITMIEERDLYLVEKEITELHISPELGVDFLKSPDSSWIISLYLQTTFMSGGMNQMLGHVRLNAGIKIGKYW
jgi:hypothetical protein